MRFGATMRPRTAPRAGAAVRRSRVKHAVSRAWRKMKGDRKAWNDRSLENERVIRRVLDDAVGLVRLHKKAASTWPLVALDTPAAGEMRRR